MPKAKQVGMPLDIGENMVPSPESSLPAVQTGSGQVMEEKD